MRIAPNVQKPFDKDTFPDWMVNFVKWVSQQLSRKIEPDVAVRNIMLQSDGGKVYEITVDDTGNLVTTKRFG